MLVSAMRAKGVACEYETFLGTSHGVSLGTGTPAEGWLDRAVLFWQAHS